MKDVEHQITKLKDFNSKFSDLDSEKEKTIEARLQLVRQYGEGKGSLN